LKKLLTFGIVLLLLSGLSFAQSPVPDNAVLEKIADGFDFVEGPVWDDTLGLLFSDLQGNAIYRWTEEDSAVIYLSPSANSNGLAYDSSGQLIIAQTGLRRVALQDSNGTIVSIADTFDGKKLNSPNDLAVKSDGSIFFTDPPFNIPSGQQQELSFSGIFRISPSGDLQLLDNTLNLPNGICFSPDESKLYVNNSQARVIYVWDVEDSTINNKREFARITPQGYADGMKVDSGGNLFCTGPLGVWVFSPDGDLLDTIRITGSSPSNCNWGDADRKTLYITAGSNVYRIRLEETLDVKDRGELPGEIELFQNYPNPFNPTTNFGFRVSESGTLSLKIYDVLGNEITTIIEGEFTPGEYNIPFSADILLSSGTYFYQLQSGDFLQTKKLIFMK